jgi:glycosyltransferase involved in cell wall biosynthesis
MVYDIPTRRFPVRKRDTSAFDRINAKLMQGKHVTQQEETLFLQEMINSPLLYEYIETHSDEYDLFIFLPYMFGTTFHGVLTCPEKAVMIPCFHDEAYAHMRTFRQTYINVRGMIFNSVPEMQLANRLYDLQEVEQICTGIGMNTSISGDAAAFREKYGISAPFLLYAGRKDSGKNVHTLLQYFAEYKKRNPQDPLQLVLIGGGELAIPESVQDSVHDLGFVPAQDKYDAMSAALFLCQPSKNESFSLVIMESWLCGKPVLVHAACAVTKDFAQRAEGGLYFNNYFEFEGCVRWLETHPEAAEQLGQNGREFVVANFDWNVVMKKYLAFFQKLIEKGERQ